MQKKLKDKAFARGVHREQIFTGAEQLGVDLDEHIAFVIAALRPTTRLVVVNAPHNPTGMLADRATFDKPHQYAVGMKHVFVNGVQVLKDGEHTGAKPGRALAGPGKLK